MWSWCHRTAASTAAVVAGSIRDYPEAVPLPEPPPDMGMPDYGGGMDMGGMDMGGMDMGGLDW